MECLKWIQARDAKPRLQVWELRKDPGRRELSGEAPAPSLGPRVWLILHLCPTMWPSAKLPNKPACPGLSPSLKDVPRTSPAFQLLLAKEGPQVFFRVAALQPLWGQKDKKMGPVLSHPWGPGSGYHGGHLVGAPHKPLGCGRVQRKGTLWG